MNAIVYGIPNCASVKKAIHSLKECQATIFFHDFKKLGVPCPLLQNWINIFGLDQVINRKGTTWRSLSDVSKNKIQTAQGAKDLLLEYPTLIKRPIVEFEGRLSIGQIDFTKGHS